MTNQRLYKKRKFKRMSQTIISPEMFHNELALIVNYPDADGNKEKKHRGYWVFSYLLCNTRWHATGSCANEFSSLFTSSGRSIAFINEFQDQTCRTKTRNCFRDSCYMKNNELIN